MLAVGFCIGSINEKSQAASVALLRVPSLELIGLGQHPDLKLGDFMHVENALGGRLRFGPDNRILFTTSKYTIAWKVASLPLG